MTIDRTTGSPGDNITGTITATDATGFGLATIYYTGPTNAYVSFSCYPVGVATGSNVTGSCSSTIAVGDGNLSWDGTYEYMGGYAYDSLGNNTNWNSSSYTLPDLTLSNANN